MPGKVCLDADAGWRRLGGILQRSSIGNETGWRESSSARATVLRVDVEPERVAELHLDGTIQLVDIREPYEWEAGRIPGARHLEASEVAAQAETIQRETPVVFYCRVGGRSTMAADSFRRAGFDAYSMTGGMLAWASRGFPLEPDDGYVADH